MSASASPVLAAVAFQLAAALDAYDHEVDALMKAHFDPELYGRVSHRMDEMRLYAAALPPLSAPWVEVLIRHAELTHGMWRAQQPAAAVDLPQLRLELGNAVQRLSHKCTKLMPAA